MNAQEALTLETRRVMRRYERKRDAIISGKDTGSLKVVEKSIALAMKKLLCPHTKVIVGTLTLYGKVRYRYYCDQCKQRATEET